jgi:hypothetical protein
MDDDASDTALVDPILLRSSKLSSGPTWAREGLSLLGARMDGAIIRDVLGGGRLPLPRDAFVLPRGRPRGLPVPLGAATTALVDCSARRV